MNKEIVLFKDKFIDYSSKDGEAGRIIEDFEGLNDAISDDLQHRLDVLLCGLKIEDLIEKQSDNKRLEYSSSERGEHESKTCDGVNRETEREICKCIFFNNCRDKVGSNGCLPNCYIKQPWINKSEQFVVIDYEFPMPFKHSVYGVGKVDLIIEDSNCGVYYAVEVKPPHGNKNTISLMMAETLTYTAILESAGEYGMKNNKRLQPAIAFFKDSIQWNKYYEYKDLNNPYFENLLKVIKVFEIEKKNEDGKCLFEFYALN